MRRQHLVAILLAAFAVPVTAVVVTAAGVGLGAAAGPRTAVEVAAASEPASAQATPTAGWQCRTGTAPVTANLVSSGTVCGRFDGTAWRGKATVTLTAQGAPVSGQLGLGANRLPELPAGVANTPFTVQPGHSLTLAVESSEAVDPQDTGVFWSVSPYLSPEPGSGFLLAGVLTSPLITRHPRPVEDLGGSGAGDWACSVADVSGEVVRGQATLCVRQQRGWVESRGTLTYTAQRDTSYAARLVVDGIDATRAEQILAASPSRSATVTLPATRSRVLTRDDTAQMTLTVVEGAAPLVTQRSQTIALG